MQTPTPIWRGSATSGNYGHAGRPGQVGGSAPGGTSAISQEGVSAFYRDATQGGLDPAQVRALHVGAKQFTGLVGGKLNWELAFVPISPAKLGRRDGRMRITGTTADGTIAAEMSMELKPDEQSGGLKRVLHVNYATVVPNLAHDGLGQNIIETVLTTAQQAHVNYVQFESASSIGSYVWAKMGARFTSTTEQERVISAYRAYVLKTTGTETRVDYRAQPTDIYHDRVNGRDIGREFLADENTHGFAGRFPATLQDVIHPPRMDLADEPAVDESHYKVPTLEDLLSVQFHGGRD